MWLNLIIFILLKSQKKIRKNLKKVLLFHFQKTNLQFVKIPRKKKHIGGKACA
jgi:hypothetical protein